MKWASLSLSKKHRMRDFSSNCVKTGRTSHCYSMWTWVRGRKQDVLVCVVQHKPINFWSETFNWMSQTWGQRSDAVMRLSWVPWETAAPSCVPFACSPCACVGSLWAFWLMLGSLLTFNWPKVWMWAVKWVVVSMWKPCDWLDICPASTPPLAPWRSG